MAAQEIPPLQGEGDRVKRGGGGLQSLRRPETYIARKLRREMTLPEVLLWRELRGNKLGPKFRRQHPVGPYIADFYCSSARLIVEVDGEAHDRGNNPERDAAKDAYLLGLGFRVLRIAAVDVLRNLEGVLLAIGEAADTPLHRSAVPLPAGGEEFND